MSRRARTPVVEAVVGGSKQLPNGSAKPTMSRRLTTGGASPRTVAESRTTFYAGRAPAAAAQLAAEKDLSAILRAAGTDFDVAAYVRDATRRVDRVYHRGELRSPSLQSSSRRTRGPEHIRSGLTVVVSEADFGDFPSHTADAICFLRQHEVEVLRLVKFPGVEGVDIDFGIAFRDVVAQSDTFAAELVGLAGRCGIALTLSMYPVGADG